MYFQEQKKKRERCPDISKEEYEHILEVLGREKAIPVKKRSPLTTKVYKKISQYKFELKLVHDPYLGLKKKRLMMNNKILLPREEIEKCITAFHDGSKGDGTFKLKSRIACHYFGIGRRVIQRCLNNLESQRQRQCRFDNKAPLRPVEANLIMERHQIDIVDLQSLPVNINGVRYRYVLSILDVFSRFLWLRPLPNKNSNTVAKELYRIYLEFGPPKIIQTDQGGEFKGTFRTLCRMLKTRLIYSRMNHPQSQGKDERSHRTWKEKIRHDIFTNQNEDCNWVDALPVLQRIYNEGRHRTTGVSPYTLLFGITSNHVINTLDARENGETSEVEVNETDFIDEGNVTVSTEAIEHHKLVVQAIREKSKQRAVKENQKMIGKRLKKFPPSEYAIGDQVYVKLLKRDQRVKRGGTSIVAPKVHDGTVIEADAKNYRYKISINHPDSRSDRRWIGVDDITSKKYSEEQKKKKAVRSKKGNQIGKQVQPKQSVANSFNLRSNFQHMQNLIIESLQLSAEEERRKASLLQNAQRRNLELHADNDGGGDCMFYALQHQLLTHGIEIDASIIRQQVVEFLRSHPTLTTPDGNVVTFSDFIHNQNGWDAYLNDLSRSGVWGDYLTLIAASNVFGLRIVVVSSIQGAQDITINPIENNEETTEIYLGHLHELHYVSLIQSKSTSGMEECANENFYLCFKCGSQDNPHSCLVADLEKEQSQTHGTNNDSGEVDQGAEQADMEHVIEYLQREILREQDTSHGSFEVENSVNAFHDLRCNGVPVCVNNARVHMFIKAMKQRSKEYMMVETVWGQFAFIPEADMEIFESNRDAYMNPNRSYRLDIEPLRYWLTHVYEGNVTEVDFSEGTAAEMSHDVANDYDSWIDSIKLNLRLSM